MIYLSLCQKNYKSKTYALKIPSLSRVDKRKNDTRLLFLTEFPAHPILKRN